MLICELAPEFNRPDPNNPTVCIGEVDVYARDPKARPGHDYRLSIRRSWLGGGPGPWQLYREFHVQGALRGTKRTEIVLTGPLEEVCDAANAQWLQAWGHTTFDGTPAPQDAPCDHGASGDPAKRSSRCSAEVREIPPRPSETDIPLGDPCELPLSERSAAETYQHERELHAYLAALEAYAQEAAARQEKGSDLGPPPKRPGRLALGA